MRDLSIYIGIRFLGIPMYRDQKTAQDALVGSKRDVSAETLQTHGDRVTSDLHSLEGTRGVRCPSQGTFSIVSHGQAAVLVEEL